MEVKANVQLTTKQMFQFLMYHTYSTVAGVIGIIISIAAYGGAIYMLTIPEASMLYIGSLFVIGLLFTVVQPVMIYNKAKRQVIQSEAINKPLEYTIDEEGVHIAQDDKTGFSSWSEIVKVKAVAGIVILYTGKMHAYVIPVAEFGDRYEDLKKIVWDNCRIRRIKF